MKMQPCSRCSGKYLPMKTQALRMARKMCTQCHGFEYPEERADDLAVSEEATAKVRGPVREGKDQENRKQRVSWLEERIRRGQYSADERRRRDDMMHWIEAQP